MLIRLPVLERIAAGEIDTVFRRQKRPTVRPGGTLRTPVGMLEILEVQAIELDDVTDEDAHRSGAADRHQVIAELLSKPEGQFLRVRVGFGGADPRLALRCDAALSEADIADLTARLDRLDRASRHGPWTRQMLRMLAERPHVRAPDLAASVGRETLAFKNDVRKLKALGLTISHSPGYELSPARPRPARSPVVKRLGSARRGPLQDRGCRCCSTACQHAPVDADELIAAIGLRPHPEGGHYVETWRGDGGCDGRAVATAIYFLLRAGERSHWHRVDADEVWLFHSGAPLRLEIAHDDGGRVDTHLLGTDLVEGHMPQVVVPADRWQAAESTGEYSLVSCVVAPGFVFEGFELAPADWRPI